MKPRFRKFFIWSIVSGMALGCGPFFPDTMLDNPQAALAVPVTSYLHDLHKLTGREMEKIPCVSQDNEGLLGQIPLEVAELKAYWQSQGVEDSEVRRRMERYTEVRTALLKPIAYVEMMGFPAHPDTGINLPERPLGADFPLAVADYVEAARLHAVGKKDLARDLWKGILQRQNEEKKLRSLWAAWMLAKTSPSQEECMEWYARVEDEAKLGGTDVLGLRTAAKSWRAPRLKDPIESLRMLYECFVEGKEAAALDIREVSYKILKTQDPVLLDRAAADPIVRKLLNLEVYAVDSSSKEFDAWCVALEKHAGAATEGAARIAWAHYSAGKYEESRRWLALAEKNDPMTQWLRAKFALRDGNADASAKFLAEAIRLRSAEPDWKPQNHYSETRWYDGGKELQSLCDGRLLGESGVVALAHGEYVAALDQLSRAGFWPDAAYIAENVLSTNALLAYVRKVAPRWNEKKGLSPEDRFDYWNFDTGNRLRWVLARRLNREKRFAEAREFIPPDFASTFQRYVKLDQAKRSGRFSGETRAAILWEQAMIHRHYGAELFSTEGGPDGGAYDWRYSVADLRFARSRKDGWKMNEENWEEYVYSEKPEDRATPAVNPDEMVRSRRYGLKNRHRYHYRYDAAELAWEAGKSLPANHPELARLYTTAGSWISGGNPQAADRFYQAIVSRCRETPEGKTAEIKRWFSADLISRESLSSLPQEFRIKP